MLFEIRWYRVRLYFLRLSLSARDIANIRISRNAFLIGNCPSGDGACPVWDGGWRRRQQADRVRGLRAGRMPRLRRRVRPGRLRLEASPRYADSEVCFYILPASWWCHLVASVFV